MFVGLKINLKTIFFLKNLKNNINKNKNIKKMNKYTIDDILNLLDLPELNKYIYSSIDWKDPNYYHYIENGRKNNI